jgi:cell division protein FtsB
LNRSRGRWVLAGDATRALAVVFVVGVTSVTGSASFASTAMHRRSDSTPRQQIAALKRQVQALKAQVKDLRGNVKFLNARVAALQEEATLTPQLAEMAVATAKYRTLDNALADGYVYAGVPCIPKAGVHYVLGGWPDDDVLDALRPEVLMYAQVAGVQKLVALEYAVPARYPRPKFLGGTFEMYSGALGGHRMWFLHVWLWHLNPAGLFAAENSSVEC